MNAGLVLPTPMRLRLATEWEACLGLDGVNGHAQMRVFRCSEGLQQWRHDALTFVATPVEGTW
jgi:hypothetical protein